MADSLSISPVALFAPAGISPIASTLPVTARFAADSSLFADERSVVELSTEGQLLSALSTFRASLLPQPEATPAATGNDQAAATTIAATDPTTATPPPTDTNDLLSLTQPQVTPGLAPATIDTLAAEQRSTAANLTLQNLLTDPRLRAINNQFDPAYAAVIAASHLSDFDSPRPFIDPTALATDTVGPVSALVRAQAIADYREAAGEAERRTLIGTSTTHQYWI